LDKHRFLKVTRKAPGALDPAIVLPPLGCKIYYVHSRYEPKWCSGSFQFEYLFGLVEAKTGSPGEVTVKKKTKMNMKEKNGYY